MTNYGVWVIQKEYIEVMANSKEEAEQTALQELLKDKYAFDGTFAEFETTDVDELDERVMNMVSFYSPPMD